MKPLARLCLIFFWGIFTQLQAQPTNPAVIGKPIIINIPQEQSNNALLANMITAGASFDVASISSFENTMQVIAPGANASCPEGKTILSTGEPREVYTRPLFDAKGAFMKNAPSVKSTTPSVTDGWLGTDNILVKSAPGTLMMVRAGASWRAPASKPNWWNNYKIQGNPNGSRIVLFILQSKDCGKTWQEISTVDPMDFDNGQYAAPRPIMNAFGGWDRPEAYFDPFTKALYVTVNAAAGIMNAQGKITKAKDANGKETNADAQYITHFLFKSADGGKTWKKLHQFDGWTPIVMTSTPNGRLYLYSAIGTQPYLKYSLASTGHTTFSAWYPVNYHLANDEKAIFPVGVNPAYSCATYKATNSIARATSGMDSKVRLSYPIMNGSYQTGVAVFEATIEGDQKPPVLKSLALLYAQKASKGSILASGFVEADVSMPASAKTTKSMFWWVEEQPTTADPKFLKDPQGKLVMLNGNPVFNCSAFAADISARYLMFENSQALGFPKSLPLSSNGLNAPKTWNIPNIDQRYYGDYAYGGSFFWNGNLYFFGQWREQQTVSANYIKVKP